LLRSVFSRWDRLKVLKNKKTIVFSWAFPVEMTASELDENWINPRKYKYEIQLNSLGIYDIKHVNCYKDSFSDIMKCINESGLIILMGGNPHMLKQKLNSYRKAIKNFKGLIIGESAGALIFFDNYFITKQNSFIKKFEELEGFDNFKLDFLIDVHSKWDEDYIKKIKSLAKKYNKNIIMLDDDSVLFYGDMELIGNAKIIIPY
jgi:peptidase E